MLTGKGAGGVGIMIGVGVGLVVGGLASYALEKTYSYSDELDRRIESLPRVVKWLIAEGEIVWLVFPPVTGAVMAVFATGFIVHQMAG
jgi:hypothetical protein